MSKTRNPGTTNINKRANMTDRESSERVKIYRKKGQLDTNKKTTSLYKSGYK
jgi:hypothetical protein